MSEVNARDIRSKIANVRKVRTITSTMQRIAWARMAQARRRAEMVRPYARYIRRTATRMAHLNHDYLPALMVQRTPVRRIGLLLVTTDKGLCGALNTRLLHLCLVQLQAWQQQGIAVAATVVGTRGASLLRRAGIALVAQVPAGSDAAQSEDLLGTLSVPVLQFMRGDIDELYVATNRFVNTLSCEPLLARFLPLGRELHGVPAELQPRMHAADRHHLDVDFHYEPDMQTVVDAVLQRYLETMLYQAVVENAACEQAARMTAMRQATDNADRLIGELTLHYNKVRQEAITRELIEIVAGADAIHGR